MEHTLVLLNAAAGRGRSRKKIERVRALSREAGAQVVDTSSVNETKERARLAAEAGARVVAAGGDGTVHHVLNAVVGTPGALAIIPVGSGNDLARNLRIPSGVDEATRFALTGPRRRVDAARVNGRWFGGVASFGLDSRANQIANEHQRISGTLLYIYALLRALIEWRQPMVRVQSDGGEFHGRIMLAVAANTTSYGGGMKIAPKADMTDGRFDLCIVSGMSRLKLLRCFPEVFWATHLRHREVTYMQATRARIEADRPLDIFADGEFVGRTPVEIEVAPAALSVIAPP